jgi:hypothetical protein
MDQSAEKSILPRKRKQQIHREAEIEHSEFPRGLQFFLPLLTQSISALGFSDILCLL